jgi:hypothetical protein
MQEGDAGRRYSKVMQERGDARNEHNKATTQEIILIVVTHNPFSRTVTLRAFDALTVVRSVRQEKASSSSLLYAS